MESAGGSGEFLPPEPPGPEPDLADAPAAAAELREAVREQVGDGPIELGARTWVAVASA